MGLNVKAFALAAGVVWGLAMLAVGMANMRAITSKFGMSAKAFLIIPLLGAFFIDITNALVIQFFMGLPFFQ